MATPYVAGLLGLMKSLNPDLTTEQAYEILKETGIDTGSTDLTGKFIQPLNAISAVLK
jgi:thermitase